MIFILVSYHISHHVHVDMILLYQVWFCDTIRYHAMSCRVVSCTRGRAEGTVAVKLTGTIRKIRHARLQVNLFFFRRKFESRFARNYS